MANADGSKSGGRKKGSKNKRSFDLEEILKANDYDPIEEVIKTLKARPKTELQISKEYTSYIKSCKKNETNAIGFKEFRNRELSKTLNAKDKSKLDMKLAKFVYPQKKSVEVITKTSEEGYKLGYNLDFDPNEIPDFSGVDDEQ